MEKGHDEKRSYADANLYPQINPPPYNEAAPQPYGPPPSQPYGPPPSQPQGPSAPSVTVLPPGTTVVQGVIAQPVGPRTANVTCRSCNKQIMTRVEYTPSTKTHIIALLLCLFGCCLCACIPYCMDSCKNAEHYCPDCSSYIGAYQG